MRPITDILRDYRRGVLVEEASEALSRCVKAVMETGEPGEVAIVLKIKVPKGQGGEISMAGAVKSKEPRPPLPEAIFYPDDEGGLHRADPKQRAMDGLFKEVPSESERDTA